MPMALSSASSLVPQGRIRRFKRGHFTEPFKGSGPKGLDQRGILVEYFFRGRVFYAFTSLVAVSCARVSIGLTA